MSVVKLTVPESRRTHITVFACCVFALVADVGSRVAGRANARMEDVATARSEQELHKLHATGNVQLVAFTSAH